MSEVIPVISNFYRPIDLFHGNDAIAPKALDARLSSLASGLLGYEHAGEESHRHELVLMNAYLTERLAASVQIGSIGTNRVTLHLGNSVSMRIVNRTLGKSCYVDVNTASDWIRGKFVDSRASRIDLTGRPYAIGKIMTAAFDASLYLDGQTQQLRDEISEMSKNSDQAI